MGGTSKSSQFQQSKSDPWAPAQPVLEGILGQLQGQMGSTALTGNENNALNQITANAQAGNPFAPAINDVATNLLAGGGANAQTGNIQGGLDAYRSQLTPYANGSMIGNNPALQAQIDTIMSDVGNSVNSQFAAAGRDLSGANQQAYGRGVAQGIAPVLANQYNQDVQNQLSAAGSLYGAQNTSSGLLAGLNQQGVENQKAGVAASTDALNANNAGANSLLQAEAIRRGIPTQQLGLLAQIGIPIAGLGGSSSGNVQGSKTMSGLEQAKGYMSLGTDAAKLAMMLSDSRAKEDVKRVGALSDGTPVYGFRYIGSPTYQIGLMAQDIEKNTPEAVTEINGLKHVDYWKATANARKVENT